MRQEHETTIATSFNQLKEITQIMQAQETGSKPKANAQAKKGALKPTKRAFSERQRTETAFRDNSQASAKQRLKTEQGHNSSLRADPSYKAFKPGLTNTQENQKGDNNEA